MYKLTKTEAHITVKDHKEDFRNNVQCRLVNPTKSEIGIASKQILRTKIELIKIRSKLESLKDSNCAKCWFTDLRQKHNLTFLQWDFLDFYPKPLYYPRSPDESYRACQEICEVHRGGGGNSEAS